MRFFYQKEALENRMSEGLLGALLLVGWFNDYGSGFRLVFLRFSVIMAMSTRR